MCSEPLSAPRYDTPPAGPSGIRAERASPVPECAPIHREEAQTDAHSKQAVGGSPMRDRDIGTSESTHDGRTTPRAARLLVVVAAWAVPVAWISVALLSGPSDGTTISSPQESQT